MFYDKFLALCSAHNLKPSVAADKIEINRATVTNWKKGAVPSGEILGKVANYFDVPVAFLMETPPFDMWEHLNEKREEIIWAMGYPSAMTEQYIELVSKWSVEEFVKFVSHNIAAVYFSEDGQLSISPIYRNMHKYSTQKEKPATEGDELTEEERALLNDIMSLNQKNRDVVRSLLSALASPPDSES